MPDNVIAGVETVRILPMLVISQIAAGNTCWPRSAKPAAMKAETTVIYQRDVLSVIPYIGKPDRRADKHVAGMPLIKREGIRLDLGDSRVQYRQAMKRRMSGDGKKDRDSKAEAPTKLPR